MRLALQQLLSLLARVPRWQRLPPRLATTRCSHACSVAVSCCVGAYNSVCPSFPPLVTKGAAALIRETFDFIRWQPLTSVGFPS